MIADLENEGEELTVPSLGKSASSPVFIPAGAKASDLRRTVDSTAAVISFGNYLFTVQLSISRSVKFAELPPPHTRAVSSDSIPFLSPVPTKSALTKKSPALPETKGDAAAVEKFDFQLKLLLDEYLCSLDMTEALIAVEELKRPDLLDRFVSKSVVLCMDKKEKYREDTAKLLSKLVQEHILLQEHFTKG